VQIDAGRGRFAAGQRFPGADQHALRVVPLDPFCDAELSCQADALVFT
jgi:hypothetical protein